MRSDYLPLSIKTEIKKTFLEIPIKVKVPFELATTGDRFFYVTDSFKTVTYTLDFHADGYLFGTLVA